MSALFITGGSGFVGRSVLGRLRLEPVETLGSVVCLTRDPAALTKAVPPPPGWRYAAGDLRSPDGYEELLPPGGRVLHLGATTGSAPARSHREVIVEGTRDLLARCRARGVERIVYISSIAAKFTDQRYYHYARAKLEAEMLVRESGLPYLIVRPTMVLGAGSPVLDGLRKLATAPAAVVFGNGRAMVQPIHVEDLARILVTLVRAGPVEPGILELGGPEALPIGELLRRIRLRVTGRAGPAVHIPARPARALLAAAEGVFGDRLPLRPGQLASFLNDGTAEPHPLVPTFVSHLSGIESMLSHAGAHA